MIHPGSGSRSSTIQPRIPSLQAFKAGTWPGPGELFSATWSRVTKSAAGSEWAGSRTRLGPTLTLARRGTTRLLLEAGFGLLFVPGLVEQFVDEFIVFGHGLAQ